MTTVDLKPCPWCGRYGMLEFKHAAAGVSVECIICEARGPVCETMDQAASVWNEVPRIKELL